MADSVIKSLTAVGNIKPKYPFLSSTKSALVYVAFHLKGECLGTSFSLTIARFLVQGQNLNIGDPILNCEI